MPYAEAFDPVRQPDKKAITRAEKTLALGLRLHWIKRWDSSRGASDEQLAEIRKIFKVGKVAVIAGCYVTDGRIVRGGGARVWRGGKVITTDRIESLRRLKDDVREVATNFECGIGLAGSNDLIEGDIIECFTQQMVSRAAG